MGLEEYTKCFENVGRSRKAIAEVRESLRNLRDLVQVLYMGKCIKDSSHRGNSMYKDIIESWTTWGLHNLAMIGSCKRGR